MALETLGLAALRTFEEIAAANIVGRVEGRCLRVREMTEGTTTSRNAEFEVRTPDYVGSTHIPSPAASAAYADARSAARATIIGVGDGVLWCVGIGIEETAPHQHHRLLSFA